MRDQEGGSIVNISSIAALAAATRLTAYKLSKAAINALSQSLAIDNAAHGIRVNTIMPGLLDTPMAVDARAAHTGVPREQVVAQRAAAVPLRAQMERPGTSHTRACSSTPTRRSSSPELCSPSTAASSPASAVSHMTSVVLIPGAGGLGWYWHLVERDLRERGYDALAVDLAAYGRTGLPAYADAVVDAIGDRTDVALVAQSMGAFTAPLVWQRVPTRLLVFVNAMIPRPGETPGEWWDNVGSEQSRTAAAVRDGYGVEFDLNTYFMHDVPERLVDEMRTRAASQLDESFDDVCTFTAWPPIPIYVVAGREDRFFPVELQQRVARDRLGVEPTVVPGGHLAALSYPEQLTDVIAGYLGSA